MAIIVKAIRHNATIEIRDLPPWITDWYRNIKTKEAKGLLIEEEESLPQLISTIRHRFTNYDEIVDEIAQEREIHEIAQRIKRNANRKIRERLSALVPDPS